MALEKTMEIAYSYGRRRIYLSPLFYPEEDYDGLYVTNDGEMYKGSGLILGKDSPFRNIPILGWLL